MPRTVLFTGFPGFLGTELVPRVLRRDGDAQVVCLVQAAFAGLAQERVDALVAADASLAGRIELVIGDITVRDLGLGEAYDDLARRTTEVFHLAAVYDLEVTRELGMRVNVDGTRHVVDFCRACDGLERLQYVSTCYVSGRFPGIFRETDLIKPGQVFNNFYEETKHLAEVIVAEAAAGGLPVTTYRPSVVGGDSTTGATQKYDGPYFVLRLLLRQPNVAVMPTVGDPDAYRFNVVPRDFVVDGIDALAARADTLGGTYALADPEPYTIRQLIDVAVDATGKKVTTVPLSRRLVKGTLRISKLAEAVGLPPAAVDYFSHPTHYTTDQADALLAEEGISRPDRETWFRAMAAYVRANPDVTSKAMV